MGERDGARETNSPSHGLLPKCLQELDVGQDETRSQELCHGLPHGWQDPNCLGYYPLLSNVEK